MCEAGDPPHGELGAAADGERADDEVRIAARERDDEPGVEAPGGADVAAGEGTGELLGGSRPAQMGRCRVEERLTSARAAEEGPVADHDEATARLSTSGA